MLEEYAILSVAGSAAARGVTVRVKRPGERRSLSRSATRALDVLEIFGQLRRPLRAVEIAHALNLPASTANQLLKTMVGSSHLMFDAVAKSYLPSPRLSRFGTWMIETYGSDDRLSKLIHHVQRETGEIVTLTTPNDLFMQLVDWHDAGPVSQAASAERGLNVSIFGSATGTAYLVTLPETEVARLAERARINAEQFGTLRAELARIRDSGVADCKSGNGTWSVAARLSWASFPAPLILGLAGPQTRIQAILPRLRELLRQAAARPAMREDALTFQSE